MSFPEWVEPMAATLTQERFTGPEWMFERKYDGIRLLAYKNGGDVTLFSRNRLPQNIPALADAIAKLPVRDAILDGEMDWPSTRDDDDARSGQGIRYHIFDVLRLDGHLGLHPRLTGLKRLFDDGQVAILQGVGYPHPNRSHFQSMDIWHSAQPENNAPADGWLGRSHAGVGLWPG